MRDEFSLVFIKPMPPEFPAGIFNEEQQIAQLKEMASNRHLEVSREFRSLLTARVLDVVYPFLKPQLRSATHSHLLNRDVPVPTFYGMNAMGLMTQAIGDSVNPRMCAEYTFRHQCWKEIWRHRPLPSIGLAPQYLVGGEVYWYNYAHRTTTEEEFRTHLEVLLHR